jgi:hypothetical protein
MRNLEEEWVVKTLKGESTQRNNQYSSNIQMPTDEIDAAGLILDPAFLGKSFGKFIRKDPRERTEE